MAIEEPDQKVTNITTDLTIAVLALLFVLAVFGVYFSQIFGWYGGLVEWFYSGDWGGVKSLLVIIFSVFDTALLVLIVITIRLHAKLYQVRPKKAVAAHQGVPRDEIKNSWEQIRNLANSASPSDWNMAVLRADALLDDILRGLGYAGTTMAERLKIVDPTKLPSLDHLWSAHRLRNMMAHDPLEQHTKETIIHALRSYEQALKELGMMEEINSLKTD